MNANQTSGPGLPLRLDGVACNYGEVSALRPCALVVGAGEFLTLLGPSGSGKTTLLNLVAGYVEPTAGRVHLGEREITHLPARARNIGMVFQSYALFPHLDVRRNVGYGLKVRGCRRTEIDRRVNAMLDLVQLSDYGGRAVHQLSGGQRQRVALARALVIEPDLVLMDEPLGALDRQLRRTVQLELRRLHDARRRTTVYVTHDQEEALILSDRIAVMRDGGIEQVGTATELYERPANSFVAGFIGESNLLPVRIKGLANGHADVAVAGLGRDLAARAAPGLAVGAPAQLLIRPEHLSIEGGDGVAATVEERVYLGEVQALGLRLETGERLWLRRLGGSPITIGAQVRVGWRADQLQVLPVNPS